VLAGSLIFSLVNALQVWVQVLGIPVPSDIAVMMPYVLTILVLVVTVQRVRPPAALTKIYERGE
jgi:simple sugar transport system permease protein